MELLLHINKKLKKTSDHKKMRSAFRGRRLRGLFPILKRRKFCNKDHGVTMEILWGNYESKKDVQMENNRIWLSQAKRGLDSITSKFENVCIPKFDALWILSRTIKTRR